MCSRAGPPVRAHMSQEHFWIKKAFHRSCHFPNVSPRKALMAGRVVGTDAMLGAVAAAVLAYGEVVDRIAQKLDGRRIRVDRNDEIQVHAAVAKVAEIAHARE